MGCYTGFEECDQVGLVELGQTLYVVIYEDAEKLWYCKTFRIEVLLQVFTSVNDLSDGEILIHGKTRKKSKNGTRVLFCTRRTCGWAFSAEESPPKGSANTKTKSSIFGRLSRLPT